MASKFFRAFNTIVKKLPGNKSKVAPTITQPRQLKTTMKKIQSENKRFGFTKAKTATDRANIVRRKKSIERMDKLEKAKSKVKTGEKGKKEIQKLIDTGQADRVGSGVYHRGIREKKAMGGVIDKKKKKEQKESEKGTKPKDLIYKPKKMERLKQLREELGMKKGGKVKKKFPDLTGDGKVTQADILKGRGVFRKGGAIKPTGKVLEAIKADYKKNQPPKGSKKPGRK